MSNKYYDNRLRPAVELVPATVFSAGAALLLARPGWWFPVLPEMATGSAVLLGGLALVRGWQGLRIIRYRNRLRRMPRYAARADQIPVSTNELFVGRGFRWDQRHTQRLVEARHPSGRRWLAPSWLYQLARAFERQSEGMPALQWLRRWTAADSRWNLVRPLPPVGGDPALHGVGLEDEHTVYVPLAERVGHMLVLGTTRVGKTRLAEVIITQDIRRGEIVFVLDPKGDTELMLRMYTEAKRSGRLHHFHVFHLGYPEISERYNPIGEFSRITEPASRLASSLPSEGNSAAFREFAWRFSNIVAQALVGLGRKPTYNSLARYVTNIEPLLVDYFHHWLKRDGPDDWRDTVEFIERNIDERKIPMAMRGRGFHAIALVQFAKERGLYDSVADGLRSAFEYDKTYFDKLTASLLPLLEKLTTGDSGALLSPVYEDQEDGRPVLDFRRVIREGGIVYIGLDALSDAEVASAVGAAMFADLTSTAGELYKHGDERGLPDVGKRQRAKIALHGDEFNELVGDDFIPMVNKAGGAGVQVTAYTQTKDDVEAGIGSRAKAEQIFGNFNSQLVFRVTNTPSAELLTRKVPKARVYTKVRESRTTDDNNPETSVDFTAANADRHQETETEMITAADVMRLPKGQCFALIEGGRLYKLRLPLPAQDNLFPKSKDEVFEYLKRRYTDLAGGV